MMLFRVLFTGRHTRISIIIDNNFVEAAFNMVSRGERQPFKRSSPSISVVFGSNLIILSDPIDGALQRQGMLLTVHHQTVKSIYYFCVEIPTERQRSALSQPVLASLSMEMPVKRCVKTDKKCRIIDLLVN